MPENQRTTPMFLSTKRVALTLAVVSTLLCGAVLTANGAASQEDSETPKVPRYEVISDFQAVGVNEVRVATEAAREPGMRLVADDLRDYDNVPESGTLLVEYYDSDDTSENTGFALVFDDEEAVMQTGDTERFGEVYDDEEAEKIIEEEDGMRVVSLAEFEEENATLWGKIKGFVLS